MSKPSHLPSCCMRPSSPTMSLKDSTAFSSRPRTGRPQPTNKHLSAIASPPSSAQPVATPVRPILSPPRVTSQPPSRLFTAMATPALELRGLTKRYDDGTAALTDFDIVVEDGCFFGLLGPNGAGKTTLISAVCNLIRITSGQVRVFGEPADELIARSWVGLAEQDINLDRFLTVEETLVYHGGYFGMEKHDALDRAREMIDVFDLRPKKDVRTPKLSGGMRRRLLLARALMHRPRLVILDEPTAGVDFELRQELWSYIRMLHEGGTTILLTTHYLEEAEVLCEEIALIRRGQLIARDSAAGLRDTYDAGSLADVYVKAMAG